jgi:SAM-dependent methyltransferase
LKTKEEILQLNEKQREFYNTQEKNWATSIWSWLRGNALRNIRKQIGIEKQVFNKHLEWFGDLSNKRVLDLGCYSGNVLSLHLAKNAKYYLGIDLSDVAISQLDKKIADIPTAHAKSLDFLSDDFKEQDFDLIYAYGVLHHFENLDLLTQTLKKKLVTGGQIISYDPLETSLPIKILRLLYRPFQTDKEWEWPFTKKTVAHFANHFEIVERRGILGKTKWFFLLQFLPISAQTKYNWGKKWNAHDFEQSLTNNQVLFQCMHLTMLMKKS